MQDDTKMGSDFNIWKFKVEIDLPPFEIEKKYDRDDYLFSEALLAVIKWKNGQNYASKAKIYYYDPFKRKWVEMQE